MRIQILLTMATMCAAIGTAHAGSAPRSVDAAQLSIAGVKVGMTMAEALATAMAALHVGKAAIMFEPFPREDAVTKTKAPTYFKIEKGLEKLAVHFTPQLAANANTPMRVSMVIYEMPASSENVKSMKAAALEKYGLPSSNGPRSVTSEWCAAPHPGFGCHDYRGPVLDLSDTTIRLSDLRYHPAPFFPPDP